MKKKFNQKKYDRVKKQVFGGTTHKDMMSAYQKKYGKVPQFYYKSSNTPMTTMSMGMKTTTPKRK